MIYLDHAATTACSPEVVDAMLPYFRDSFANAASIDHLPGNAAKDAVESARAAVAALVDAKPEDVIFTSGSTEANNIVMSIECRVLTTSVEHPSVLEPHAARRAAGDGLIRVDANGLVSIGELEEALDEGVKTLVSAIATNNETGAEQNIPEIARAVFSRRAMLHLDATQAVGTSDVSLRRTPGLVGVSISAHKIHGPKGVGALVATGPFRRQLRAIQRGGGQERGLRSGTLNVPGIVGFGVAARAAVQQRYARLERLHALRGAFLARLASGAPDLEETIKGVPVSPHILSLRLPATNGRALLRALRDEVAFSLGSACATNKAEPSHVLLALGLDKHSIARTVRFSFAADQGIDTVERAADLVVSAIRSLSGYSLTA